MSFPTTNWAMLARAPLNGDTPGRVALDELCRLCWKPVRASVARRWPWPEDADDVTQDFFVHVMDRGLWQRARPDSGRFRSFLLGAPRYFLAHWRAARRGSRR